MKFEIIGEKEVRDAVSNLGPAVEASVKTLNMKTANDIRNDAQRTIRANGNIASGTLRRSIKIDTNDGWRSAEVYSNVQHDEYIEYGTRAHPIKIKNKKVLADIKTERVFGKEVRHPGTKAQPFMSPAAHKHLLKYITKLGALIRGKV